MKTKQRGGAGADLLGALVMIGLAIAFGFGVDWLVGSIKCSGRWEGSGMYSKYGLLSGCLVQATDGRWLPEDRIREVNVTRPGVSQ